MLQQAPKTNQEKQEPAEFEVRLALIQNGKKVTGSIKLPPMPKKSEEEVQKEATAKEAIKVAQENADRELYARCSKEARDSLVLAANLREFIGSKETFCISGYIEDPSKQGEIIKVAFFGNRLGYLGMKEEELSFIPPREEVYNKYQFNFSKYKVNNFIEDTETNGKVIQPPERVDYLFKVKKSFVDLKKDDNNATVFPTEEEVRVKYSLDKDTKVIKPKEGDTYTRFTISEPTIKYFKRAQSSLSDGGHGKYFWGSIISDDGQEIKMGEQMIYGAKLLEAKD